MKRSVIAYPAVFLLITCTAASVWADRPVEIGVSDGAGGSVILEYVFGDFVSTEVDINGHNYADMSLGTESKKMRKGYPALPDVSRSIVIDDTARMKVNVLVGDYYEINDIDIAPSKGNILRTVDPATVPYTSHRKYIKGKKSLDPYRKDDPRQSKEHNHLKKPFNQHGPQHLNFLSGDAVSAGIFVHVKIPLKSALFVKPRKNALNNFF